MPYYVGLYIVESRAFEKAWYIDFLPPYTYHVSTRFAEKFDLDSKEKFQFFKLSLKRKPYESRISKWVRLSS